MPVSHHLTFKKVGNPITIPTVKFGGQPAWVDLPAWPLSRSTGKPMRFIAQIDLSLIEGYQGNATWAYVFMTDEDDDFVDGTYDPNEGENCVLLQPGNLACVETSNEAQGPSLYTMSVRPGEGRRRPEPHEYEVTLFRTQDPPFISENELFQLDQEERDRYRNSTFKNKIGGTPGFLQGDEFPGNNSDDWLLALQLDSCSVPFDVNFGDAGCGYVFINKDGSDARFLWQCC